MSAHLTTRRGFIAAAGFGGVGLYGLWVAYGAAPGPFDWIGDAHTQAPHLEAASASAHGTHGAAPAGPSAEAFAREVAAFGERFRLADGSVHPRAEAVDHAAMGHGAAHADDNGDADAPLVVPIAAGKWYYLPAKLRLDVGRTYRLRMMALDVSHGASIQFGRGARMLRLRPGRVTELDLRFEQPGRHLVHCTVYCGAAHDAMQATIEVQPA